MQAAPFPRLSTPAQSRVHDRLQRFVGSGAAAFFADACELLETGAPFRAATHILGHLIRDTESALRQTLVALPEVRARLPQPQKSKCDTCVPNPRHVEEVRAILGFFDLDHDERARAWETFAGKNSENGWHRTAHRDDLHPARKPDDEFRRRWSLFLGVLDAVLDGVERKYVVSDASLDRLKASERPSKNDIDFVVKHVGIGTITEALFFVGLSPMWLEPLREHRFFEAAPDAIRDSSGTRYPDWPAARYLSAAASTAPRMVADILETIAPTDNAFVHSEFLSAALAALPQDCESATRIAEREAAWISTQNRLDYLVPERARELSVGLIRGGSVDAGLRLARASLALSTGENAWMPGARMSSWEYGNFVGAVSAALAKADLVQCSVAMTGLLRDALSVTRWSRSAIEDHEQNGGHDDVMDALLGATRDLMAQRAQRSHDDLRAVLGELGAGECTLLQRVGLHVLTVHPSPPSELVAAHLTDRAHLDDFEVFHELATLAERRFPQLSVLDQERVIEAFRSHARDRANERCGEESPPGLDVNDVYRRYLRQWFGIIASDLPEPVRAEFAGIIAQYGESDHPTFHGFITTSCGDDPSPRSTAELAALPDHELREFLLAWQPARNMHFFGPTRGPLARELQQCAKADIGRFARVSMLAGLHCRYVVAILQAVQEGTVAMIPDAASAEGLLELVEWTLSQRGGSEPRAGEDAEDDWTWARRVALDISSNIMRLVEPADDLKLLRIWEVLQRLLSDADPDPAQSKSSDEDLSFNSVRGAALHAVIALGVHLQARPESPLVPLVEATLVSMCDPIREPVAAVRRACAREFHNLRIVAPVAAPSVASLLFPSEGIADAERRAAWSAFIRWNRATAESYALLHRSYAHAIGRVGESAKDEAEALGVDLVQLSLLGVVALDDDGPLAKFVQTAPVAIRQHALEWVGRGLHRTTRHDPELLACAQRLWSWWRTRVPTTGDASDLAAFGWWFTGKGLPEEWLLSELAAALQTGGGALDWEHAVADRLAELAPRRPEVVANLLEAFLGGGDEWRYARAHKGVRATISALHATTAAPAARAIASRLVARGLAEYRSLAV